MSSLWKKFRKFSLRVKKDVVKQSKREKKLNVGFKMERLTFGREIYYDVYLMLNDNGIRL